MSQVIGKCGNICSSCPWSRYVHEQLQPNQWNDYVREVKKYTGYSPTRNPCQGCQTPNDSLAKNVGVHRALRACSARSCALDNGVENCAYCSRYACDRILLMNSGNTREIVEKRLREPITDEVYDSYVRVFRGMERLDQIHSSLSQKDLVSPKSIENEETQIVDFPDDLRMPETEVSNLRRLHSALNDIANSKLGLKDSDTLANHQLLVDRRNLIFGLLWMFGLHGDVAGDKSSLTIDSKVVTANKRKVKGIPYSEEGWQRVFRLLEARGLNCEFVPLADNRTTPSGWLRDKVPGSDRPAWSLRLTFGANWGGPEAAPILRSCVRHLAEEHGNKAYTHFIRADMRGIGS